MEYNIQTLVTDIAKGKCVLFLGPELLVNKEGKYYKAFFKQIARTSENDYNYFSKDNLFSVSGNFPTIKKRALIEKVSEFYQEAGDEIVLNLIAQIPFSLIINVSPDMGINSVFDRNHYAYRSAYFPDQESNNIQSPTIKEPVIYNIFGRIDDNQSLIITHDDLFKSIKALMQKDSLPMSIYNSLRNAQSFIFLGVQFETWYYQLLLSILEIDKSPSIRIGAPSEVDYDTVSVMNSHFQISFSTNKPLKIIQDIYDGLVQKGDYIRKQTVEPPKSAAYISYAWKDEENVNREDFVDLIYDELVDRHGVNIFRDRNVLTIQDSIESFMNRIGRGKAVLIVVSDKYLKSEYCMYEAWQIYKNNNFNDRVFIAVLPDVDLSNEGINNYIAFWVGKKDSLGTKISQSFKDNFVAIDNMILRNKNLWYIYLFVDQFLKIIKDSIHFQVQDTFTKDYPLVDAEFANFTRLIVEKLKENETIVTS